MTQPAKTLRSVAELGAAGLTDGRDIRALDHVAARYAVAITPQMLQLIDRADAHDPIAAQFLPDARELATRPEERADPLDEARLSPVAGVVHRYPDRVLLKLTHVCPVYCRFCFRREVVGRGVAATLKMRDGSLAETPEQRYRALEERGLSGVHFTEIAQQILQLTQWTEEERDRFLTKRSA